MTGQYVRAPQAPLMIAPTHTIGLIEFSRTECGHHVADCKQCVEFASRAGLAAALLQAQGRGVARIGQSVLDESDLLLLVKRLGEYDAGRGRVAS